jgi:hypothetical protein
MLLQRELFDAFQVLHQQLVLATAYSNLLKSVISNMGLVIAIRYMLPGLG